MSPFSQTEEDSMPQLTRKKHTTSWSNQWADWLFGVFEQAIPLPTSQVASHSELRNQTRYTVRRVKTCFALPLRWHHTEYPERYQFRNHSNPWAVISHQS